MSPHPSSMTGFARTSGRLDAITWAWEARSVNSKGLDVRLRLPQGYEHLDVPVRQAVKQAFARGSVAIQLTVELEDVGGALRLNEELVAQLRGFAHVVDGNEGRSLSFADMLTMRGVVEQAAPPEADIEATSAAMLSGLEEVLAALATARQEEGARLSAVLGEQVTKVAGIVMTARDVAGRQPEKIRERLKSQLAVILEDAEGLPEDRLVQEVAALATRADVTEEMDRLEAHILQARDLLGSGDPVGRRLDFLCQELNREANTVCSKSTDLALTRSGMELKALIEQFREQVQNIE